MLLIIPQAPKAASILRFQRPVCCLLLWQHAPSGYFRAAAPPFHPALKRIPPKKNYLICTLPRQHIADLQRLWLASCWDIGYPPGIPTERRCTSLLLPTRCSSGTSLAVNRQDGPPTKCSDGTFYRLDSSKIIVIIQSNKS